MNIWSQESRVYVSAGRTCQKSFPEGCHFLLDEKSEGKSCSGGGARRKPLC